MKNLKIMLASLIVLIALAQPLFADDADPFKPSAGLEKALAKTSDKAKSSFQGLGDRWKKIVDERYDQGLIASAPHLQQLLELALPDEKLDLVHQTSPRETKVSPRRHAATPREYQGSYVVLVRDIIKGSALPL